MAHVGGGLDLLKLYDCRTSEEDEEGEPLEEGELLLEHGHREEGRGQDLELVQNLGGGPKGGGRAQGRRQGPGEEEWDINCPVTYHVTQYKPHLLHVNSCASMW